MKKLSVSQTCSLWGCHYALVLGAVWQHAHVMGTLCSSAYTILAFHWVGWDWVHVIRASLFGALYQPLVKDRDQCWSFCGKIGEGNGRMKIIVDHSVESLEREAEGWRSVLIILWKDWRRKRKDGDQCLSFCGKIGEGNGITRTNLAPLPFLPLTNELTNWLLWSWVQLQRPNLCSHSVVFQHFMEPECSLPLSQQLSTSTYPEPE
jgi:hypothetical protein